MFLVRARFLVRAVLLGTILPGLSAVSCVSCAQAAEGRPEGQRVRSPMAWTVDEALAQLQLNPHDPYVQYVALQLARNEKRLGEARGLVEQATGRWRQPEPEVDLFSLFTGAAAVQESLQLEAMQADAETPAPPRAVLPGPGPASPPRTESERLVEVASLQGPTVQSHPWARMLRERGVEPGKVEVSPLAMCVPEDQYFVVFRSLNKLLELGDAGDLWGAHLFTQAASSARTHRTSDRLKQQLAVKTDPLSRPFYDMVVEEVAITGSDLSLRAGSDVTLLFRAKQPAVLRMRMDAFLLEAEKSRPDAVRTTGKIGEVEYVHLSTPDRAIHVFSAYPREDLHIRSNSLPALERVLRTIAGQGKLRRLGESLEYQYVRSLMPRGDEHEDGFVYLSDPFIRRLVGPELRLTEASRMRCYSFLRMIGHAAMLYRTQYGQAPKSLEDLAEAGCAPGVFGRGKWRCPCGGTYSLSDDGTTGVCSLHGPADRLRPCCEVAVDRVTEQEAELYRQFVDRYSLYWQRYFDPIAMRVQVTPEHFRTETLILPLIDNSAYTFLAAALGGEPEPLDALPVPKRNIFSVAVRLNKQMLLRHGDFADDFLRELTGPRGQQIKGTPTRQSVEQFLLRGIGNQLAFHVYDASPMFDFNLSDFVARLIVDTRRGGLDNELLPIVFLVASLNTPVYLSIPVEDTQVVDSFLQEVDSLFAALARQAGETGFFDLAADYYRAPLGQTGQTMRSFCLQLGPVRWRVFFARLGRGLYVASKPEVLEDLAAIADKAPEESRALAAREQTGPVAHAMVRVRPENWDQILPHFQLGWAEKSRQACLGNLAPLTAVARAAVASSEQPPAAAEILRQADRLHAVHFFCPEGGTYELAPNGRQVICSVHGSAGDPRQPSAPSPRSPMGRLMREFAGATAELVFLEDGLHAVITIRRK